MIKKYLIIFLLLITVLPFSLIHSDTVERVVAKVNDGVIKLSEFEEYAEGYIENGFVKNNYIGRLEVLKKMIDYELVEQIGKEYSIVILDGEVDNRANMIMEMNKITSEEKFESMLVSQNVSPSLEAYKKEIKKSIILERLALTLIEINDTDIDITRPTEEEIKNLYEENIDKFKLSDERQISHILISAGETYTEYEESKKLAEELVSKIKEDPSLFSSFAEEYSVDEDTKALGGNLGTFTKRQLKEKYPYYVDFVFGNNVGDIKVISTEKHTAIVVITDINEGRTQSISEVYNILRNNLFFQNFEKEFPDYLEEYKDKSKIEILL